jgi:hypothetical protein
VDSPGFSKTHQFGTPFGAAAEEDEAWAGPGFTRVPESAELEPEDSQASDQAA